MSNPAKASAVGASTTNCRIFNECKCGCEAMPIYLWSRSHWSKAPSQSHKTSCIGATIPHSIQAVWISTFAGSSLVHLKKAANKLVKCGLWRPQPPLVSPTHYKLSLCNGRGIPERQTLKFSYEHQYDILEREKQCSTFLLILWEHQKFFYECTVY